METTRLTRSGHRGAESRGTTRSTPSPGTNRRGLSARGSRTVLFITRGFRDALRIAYQNRPRIFDWQIVLPEMLYSRRTDYSADWARRFSGDVEAGKSPSTSLPISFCQGDRASTTTRITTITAARTSAPIQSGTPTRSVKTSLG